MRKGYRLLRACLFCALYLVVFVASLHAADITLHVPVGLTNIPAAITEGAVACNAYAANVNGVIITKSLLGQGRTTFHITGNNYNATVDVIIKNQSNNPPYIGWICNLMLQNNGERGELDGAERALFGYTIDTSKPVKYSTSGTI